jgi:hypothetical protein
MSEEVQSLGFIATPTRESISRFTALRGEHKGWHIGNFSDFVWLVAILLHLLLIRVW